MLLQVNFSVFDKPSSFGGEFPYLLTSQNVLGSPCIFFAPACPEIQLSKEPWFLMLENRVWKPRSGARCAHCSGVSLPLGLLIE